MVEAINTDLSTELNVGETVECTVEQIMPYGAFVKIMKTGRKGMIHISELSYNFVKDINDILKIQDKIKAKIIRIDEKGRIDLSLKQTMDPSASQPQQKPQRRTNFANREPRDNFRPREQRNSGESRETHNKHDFREVRDFHEMREAYRENNPEEADSFEKKMASFLKTSEAKITDLNTRNSARSGRSTRRRNNNNRDY